MQSSENKTVRHRRSGALLALALLVSAAAATATAAGAEACPNEAARVQQGSSTLPECRAYEMVSPPQKNGGEVMPDSGRTRASVSGDAASFASLIPFADAAGSGVAAEYTSLRTAQPGSTGWDTHSIIPAVSPVSFTALIFSQETMYSTFSPDLSKAVLHSFSPLTSEPKVAKVSNIYLRPDVLSPGLGSYSLLSPCPGCASPLADPIGLNLPTVADATPDLGQIIFETHKPLTSDAGPGVQLYESDHGTLRYVGLVPPPGQRECGGGGPACEAAPSSEAGPGATPRFFTLGTISDDGSKVFFTASGGAKGDVYMRLNHTTTVQLNASERTDCADHDPCTGAPEPDPGGPQPALYETASPDGHRVFFTSPEQLTDTQGGDLYVYDTTLPASDPNRLQHVFTDQQPADGDASTFGVLGTSTDGSYVYFMTDDAILPGQPPLPNAGASLGLYVWHLGSISFIGSTDYHASTADGLPKDFRTRLGARVTPDGKTLLFTSFSGGGLTGYDHGDTCSTVALSGNGPCPELYVYKTGPGTLRCVSCNPTGAPASSPAVFDVQQSTGSALTTPYMNHPMTDDGEHVFFATGERLLPHQDVNGDKSDVYEWTDAGASGCGPSSPGFTASSNGCLSLITPGTSAEDSHFLDATPSGSDVLFTTSQRLLRWDTDNGSDLYDARIGGGLPEPPPATTECAGEACQGAIAVPALVTPPASSAPNSGNLAPTAATPPAAKPRAATPAQLLARALRTCRKRHRAHSRARTVCERQARRRHAQPTPKKGR